MDEIFHKTTSIWNAVPIARNTPRRYGKNGELLVNYLDTEEAAGQSRRRSSVTGAGGAKAGAERMEKAGALHDEGLSSSSRDEEKR